MTSPLDIMRSVRTSKNDVVILQRSSSSIVYMVFGFGGTAFLAFCLTLDGPLGYKAMAIAFLLVFLMVGVAGAIGAAGLERLGCILLTGSGITTYSLASKMTLRWDEIRQCIVEKDTGGEAVCYVVSATSADGSKLAIFDADYYPSTHLPNAEELCTWLSQIQNSGGDANIIAAAPKYLRIKRNWGQTPILPRPDLHFRSGVKSSKSPPS